MAKQIMLTVPDDYREDIVARVLDRYYFTEGVHQSHEDKYKESLVSDEAAEEFVAEACYPGASVPWVRAGVYQADVSHSQLFTAHQMSKKNPAAPVAMRGSRDVLINKHTLSNYSNNCPNGWALRIVLRYWRMKKFTCFYVDEWHKEYSRVKEAIRNKFLVTGHFDDRLLGYIAGVRGQYWVRGKHVWLTNHQRDYISRLNNIVEKFHNVDKRREALLSDAGSS